MAKGFIKKPTKKEIEKWVKAINFEGKTINDVPEDIRTYIAILMGV